MKNNKTAETHASFEKLVGTLLKLDPRALASMDTETGSTAAGLNLFVRLTLKRAIGSIWAPDGAEFRLYSDEAAKAAGWPDAATVNLSTIFVSALVRASRRARGLADIALCPTHESSAEAPRMPEAGELRTAQEYAAVATTLFKKDIIASRHLTSAPAQTSSSYYATIRKWLGVKPQRLMLPWFGSKREADSAFARDPDGAVCYGIASMLISILDVYQAAAAQEIDNISLMIVDDPNHEGRASAKRVNIGSLLTGALLSEDNRTIAFFVHKTARKQPFTLH